MVGLEGEDDKGSNSMKLDNIGVFVGWYLPFFIKIPINRHLVGGGPLVSNQPSNSTAAADHYVDNDMSRAFHTLLVETSTLQGLLVLR